MSFFSGFEDELVKLAQVPYQGRPPEISRKPVFARKFNWKGFDRKFQAEAAVARQRRALKAKSSQPSGPPKDLTGGPVSKGKFSPALAPGTKLKGKGRRKKPPAAAKPKLQKIKPQVRVHTLAGRRKGSSGMDYIDEGPSVYIPGHTHKPEQKPGIKRIPYPATRGSRGLRAAQNPKALWPWKKKKKIKPTSATTTAVDPTMPY